MIQTTVRIEGADELRRAIRRMKDRELAIQLRETNRTGAQIVVDAALPHVPVRTGRLKASLRALGSQQDGRAVAGGAAVPYAAVVHWTGPAGPFLYNAAQRMRPRVIDQYEDDIATLARRVIERA